MILSKMKYELVGITFSLMNNRLPIFFSKCLYTIHLFRHPFIQIHIYYLLSVNSALSTHEVLLLYNLSSKLQVVDRNILTIIITLSIVFLKKKSLFILFRERQKQGESRGRARGRISSWHLTEHVAPCGAQLLDPEIMTSVEI